MPHEVSERDAAYYDLQPEPYDDVPFYRGLLPSPSARVLELGCGTGRVLAALAPSCGHIAGIDRWPAMLDRCRGKLVAAGLPPERWSLHQGDIASFELGQTFDLITAPFRVLQNLETDGEVTGMLACVRRHLAPGGSCVLNAVHTRPSPRWLARAWRSDKEWLAWRRDNGELSITCHLRCPRLDEGRLILYPEMIHRRWRAGRVEEEVVWPIAMRCYYPRQLVDLVTAHGFRVLQRWGGYRGECYGWGSELVIRFA